MTTPDKTHRYDLELPEDVHWALVREAAAIRMHQEDFAEQMLIAWVRDFIEDPKTDTKPSRAASAADLKETVEQKQKPKDTEVSYSDD